MTASTSAGRIRPGQERYPLTKTLAIHQTSFFGAKILKQKSRNVHPEKL